MHMTAQIVEINRQVQGIKIMASVRVWRRENLKLGIPAFCSSLIADSYICRCALPCDLVIINRAIEKAASYET